MSSTQQLCAFDEKLVAYSELHARQRLAPEGSASSAHVLVVRQRVARLQLDNLVRIGGAAAVLDAQQVQLLLDAHVAHDVHLADEVRD